MDHFSIVAGQMAVFIVYASIGALCAKGGVLSRDGLRMLSLFITRAALPLLIFVNTVRGQTREAFLAAAPLLLLSAVFYVALFAAAAAIARPLPLSGARARLYRACCMFGNGGFMGIPIILSLFPEHGGLYIAVYTVVDQLILWTVGLDLTAPEAGNGMPLAARLRRTLNPATLAILAGLFLVFTGLSLPDPLMTALSSVGNTATPLAMIYLGGMFCGIRLAEYLRRIETYALVAGKMCLLPLAIHAALAACPFIPEEIALLFPVICGLPTMAAVSMMAESQRGDGAYAAGMTFATTLFSAATLPAVCLLL